MPQNLTNEKPPLLQVMPGAVKEQTTAWANANPDLTVKLMLP